MWTQNSKEKKSELQDLNSQFLENKFSYKTSGI